MRIAAAVARAAIVCVATLAPILASPEAHAQARWEFAIDADATWLARIPPLRLASDTSTTFNALQGASLDEGGGGWFPGLALDERLSAANGAWFVPVLGLRLGYESFDGDLALGDGVTARVQNLFFTEILLPGIGVRAGGGALTLSVSARPVYARLDTAGSATDGHTTLGIGAGPDGLGIVGDASACMPRARLCAFAEPTAMYVTVPDLAVSVGLRFGWRDP